VSSPWNEEVVLLCTCMCVFCLLFVRSVSHSTLYYSSPFVSSPSLSLLSSHNKIPENTRHTRPPLVVDLVVCSRAYLSLLGRLPNRGEEEKGTRTTSEASLYLFFRSVLLFLSTFVSPQITTTSTLERKELPSSLIVSRHFGSGSA
jgi:hypothetical protein